MQLALVVLLSALLQQTPQTGTIEGIVTRSGSTLVPIAGAQVTITAPSPFSNGTLIVLDTTTDGGGHFLFSDLPAGVFKVEVSQEGYGYRASKFVFTSTLKTSVTVAPGKRVQVPNLTLTPTSTIRGRVLDSEGHGVPNVPVEFLRMTVNDQGRKMWATGKVDTDTNDQGEYELTMLGPGDYYVRTILDTQSDLPIAVYYPGALDGSAAAAVALVEGSQMVADIRVGPAVSGPTYKVSGRVSQSADLILMKRDSLEPVELSATAAADADTGRFEFRAVRPGSYDLWAVTEVSGKNLFSTVPIEIRDKDIENVSLTLRAGVDIKGRLIVDANAQNLQLFRRLGGLGDTLRTAGSLRIVLDRNDRFPFGTAFEPVIDDSGLTFTFPAVPEGAYTIGAGLVSGTGARLQGSDLYVADIRASARSVFDTGFQVGTDPVDSMEIIVGTGAVSIEGTVQGKSELPAVVVLAPSFPREGNPSLYRTGVLPANGKFQFYGVAPGSYRLFAVPYLNETVPYRDPEFLARHESSALHITIQKGTTLGGLQVPYLNLGR
jgi:hypothetical protein